MWQIKVLPASVLVKKNVSLVSRGGGHLFGTWKKMFFKNSYK